MTHHNFAVGVVPARILPRPVRGRNRRAAALGSLVLLLLAAAGCADDEPNEIVDRVPITNQILEVASELAVLRSEMDQVSEQCLASEGFPAFPQSPSDHYQSLLDLLSVRVQAVTIDEARVEGYGNVAGDSYTTTEERINYFEGLSQQESDAYSVALNGNANERVDAVTPSGYRFAMPVGGCAGAAATQVYGSIDTYVDAEELFTDLQLIGGEVLGRADSSSAVRESLAEWSTCMSGEGQDFDVPAEAREEALASRDDASGRVSDLEVAIAVADATCQAKSSLNQVFADVVVQEQQDIVDDKERLFLAWDELMAVIESTGTSDVRTLGETLRTQGETDGG